MPFVMCLHPSIHPSKPFSFLFFFLLFFSFFQLLSQKMSLIQFWLLFHLLISFQTGAIFSFFIIFNVSALHDICYLWWKSAFGHVAPFIVLFSEQNDCFPVWPFFGNMVKEGQVHTCWMKIRGLGYAGFCCDSTCLFLVHNLTMSEKLQGVLTWNLSLSE